MARRVRRAGRVVAPESGATARFVALTRSRVFVWGALISLCFGVAAGTIAAWSREQPLLSVGQVVNATRTVRVPFRVEDATATALAREQARQQARLVYAADEAVLLEVANDLETLPRTLESAMSIDQVDAGIRGAFGLTEERLAAVRVEVEEGEPSRAWVEGVRRAMDGLYRTPLLDAQTWQRASLSMNPGIELRLGSGPVVVVMRDAAVNAEDTGAVARAMSELAGRSGFEGPLREVVESRLRSIGRATYRFDAAATAAVQRAEAERVEPQVTDWSAGAVIFTRGDVLTKAQRDLWVAEMEQYAAQAERWRVWVRRLSVVGASVAIATGGALYAGLFCPKIRRKVSRMAWVASLLLAALAVACVSTVIEPWATTATAVAPTVFVAAILVIAYDQRVALAYSSLHALLVCVAMDLPVGIFGLMLTGIVVTVWRLRDLRARDALLRMGVWAGLALGLGTVVVSSIDRPVLAEAAMQTLRDAALAALGGLGVGAVVLFVLPLIERAFDITTGMTLIELRDPKQPLLRELQQRAPGTYNHSLNVASIAEAAATEIGADALLTYAGALYHDIGKMNKPEYFVENQSGGINKHDKLSPAMSLLVIVGHVKDGMEMAREYGLPRSLQHFIEAHHGTTLVEYFYHRAKRQAGQAEASGVPKDGPSELEYRYPGPKPRTKEAAILMMADTVESTTRTLSDPTPARIEQIVRTIANKRLLDGQFDECDLTLRDLSKIVEAITRIVASIYHARIIYPEGAGASGGAAPTARVGG